MNESYARILRDIAAHAGVPPLKAAAREPGVSMLYRVTIFHHDGEHCDSVATLQAAHRGAARLTVHYVGAFGGRPLTHTIPLPRYEAFVAALHKARFDRLRDQPDLPFYGADVWMVERAAGSFVRGIILAPANATGEHAAVVTVIQTHLPEALRAVPAK